MSEMDGSGTPPADADTARQKLLHRRGMLIALWGAILVSPDGYLVRLKADRNQGPQEVIVVYKNVFVGLLGGAVAFIVQGGSCSACWRRIKAAPLHICAATIAQSGASVFLTLSFLETEVANTLLCFALYPLWAALFGRALLQERLSYFTAFALLMAVISILLVFLPHMLGNKGTNVHGDVLGVAAGASLGALLTINRSAALRCPNAGMMLASSFGSWLSVLLGYLMLLSSGNGDAILPGNGVDLAFVLLALANGACIASFYVCHVLATRHLGGAEAGLISLIEIVLGPLWVFFGYGELPSHWTFIGGALLLSTLAAHALVTSGAWHLECRRVRTGPGARCNAGVPLPHIKRSPRLGPETDAAASPAALLPAADMSS